MFPVEVLAFTMKALQTISFIEVISDLIAYDGGPLTTLACNRADKIFGPQDYKIYQNLYDLSEETAKPIEERDPNNTVSRFLERLLKSFAAFAPIPEWMTSSYINIVPVPPDKVKC